MSRVLDALRSKNLVPVLVIYYAVGVAGMVIPYTRDLFMKLTPLSLLMTIALLYMFHDRYSVSFWIVWGLILVSAGLQAQDYRSQIYRAYVEGDMDIWKSVMDQMESDLKGTGDHELMYALTEAHYGYIGYCLSVKRKKEAKKRLEQAEGYIEQLKKTRDKDPRVYSLEGALYGFRVSLEPLKAPFYGKKSMEVNERALQLGPREPQVWMEKANIEYYKPAIFGGSKKDAVPLYERAVTLFETLPGRSADNWIYLNCLAGLGIACEETDQIRKAEEVYRKILDLEPSFAWVRDELYPSFLEKHKAD